MGCGLLVRIGGRVSAFIPCGLELRARTGDMWLGYGLLLIGEERTRLTALMIEANLKRFTAVVTLNEDILELGFEGGRIGC